MSVYKKTKPARVLVFFDPGVASMEVRSQSYTFKGWGQDPIPLKLAHYQDFRGGYSFLGWATSPGSTTVVYEDEHAFTGPEAEALFEGGNLTSVRLYAVWEAATYTITLLTGEGGYAETPSGWTKVKDGEFTRTYTTADTISPGIAVPDPTRRGYDFMGWKGTDANTVQTAYTVPQGTWGDLMLSATWGVIEYKIEYEFAGGGWVPGTKVEVGFNAESVPITIPQPVRAGYKFLGWTGGFLGDTKDPNVTIPTGTIGDQTFKAVWEIEWYNIHYLMQGGDWPVDGERGKDKYNYENKDYLIPQPVRTGYTFRGWTGDNGSTPDPNVTIYAQSTGDKTYTANWKEDDYNLVFDLDGGEWPRDPLTGEPAAPQQKYTYATPDITIGELAPRAGYTFGGWAGPGLSSTNPPKSFTIPQHSTGDRAYTAIWIADRFKIRFQTDGGTATTTLPEYDVTGDKYQTYRLTLPSDVKKHGYLLAGWGVEAGAMDAGKTYWTVDERPGLPALFGAGAKNDAEGYLNLVAQWASAERAINYHAFGGAVDASAPAFFYAGEGIDLTGVGATWSDGVIAYTFAGWYEDPEYKGEAVVSIPTDRMTPIDLYAKWTAKVVYRDNLPSVDKDLVSGMPADGKVVTWMPTGAYLDVFENPYALDFSHLAWSVATEEPTTPGMYAFDAWNTTSSGSGKTLVPGARVEENIAPNASGEIELFATWTPGTYAITFAAGEYEGRDLSDVVEGLPVRMDNLAYAGAWDVPSQMPSAPWVVDGEEDELLFLGWATESGAEAATFATGAHITDEAACRLAREGDAFNTSVTLYAVWAYAAYAAHLDPQGGSLKSGLSADAATLTPAEGSSVITTPDTSSVPFEREGYVHIGWTRTKNGPGELIAPGTNIDLASDKKITLYSVWEAVTYRVEFIGAARTAYDKDGNIIDITPDTTEVYRQNDTTYDATDGIPMPRQDGTLVSPGMTLEAWATDLNGTTTYAAGTKVMIADIVSAIAKDTGVIPPYTEITEDNKTIRVVKLYGTWSARLQGTVPSSLVFMINTGNGEIEPVEASMKSQTARPIEVAKFSTSINADALRRFFPDARDNELARIALTLTDIQSGQNVKVALGSSEDVNAGFRIGAAPGGGEIALPIRYEMTLPQILAESKILVPEQTGVDLATLTYTIRVAR